MTASTTDNVLLGVGAAIFLGTAVWAVFNQGSLAVYDTPPATPVTGKAYEPESVTFTLPQSLRWVEAPSQSAGEKWRFEVFTPPQIFYNSETRQFTVIPPEIRKAPEVVVEATPVETPPVPFGPELVKTEQPLFRLQLVGAVGEGASARGTFENQINKSIIIATKGRKIPELNLEVVEFKSERRRISVAGATDVIQLVTYAVVRDLNTGETVRLEPGIKLTHGPRMATFKLPNGELINVNQGATFQAFDATFVVGEISLEPSGVVITKKGPEGTPEETRTLVVPPPAPAPKTSEASSSQLPFGF